MQLGLLFTAASTCKKALDWFNHVKGVPQEALHLWRLVDATQAPLSLCVRLQNRHLTHHLVQPAVQLTQETLSLCRALLGAESDDIEDTRPDNPSAWQQWWSSASTQTKENMQRMNLVPQYVGKVTGCLAALQSALLSAQLILAPVIANRPLAASGLDSVRFLQPAYDAAKGILELFEMGRLGANGAEYQLCFGVVEEAQGTASKKQPQLRLLAAAGGVILRRSAAGDYSLVFVDCDVVNCGEEADATAQKKGKSGAPSTASAELGVFPLGGALKVTREVDAQHALTGAFSNGSGIRYTIGSSWRLEFVACTTANQVCPFPVGNERYIPVTAEVFELVLLLASSVGEGKPATPSSSVGSWLAANGQKSEAQELAFVRSNAEAMFGPYSA